MKGTPLCTLFNKIRFVFDLFQNTFEQDNASRLKKHILKFIKIHSITVELPNNGIALQLQRNSFRFKLFIRSSFWSNLLRI